MNPFKRLWWAFTHRAYWEGIETGIALGSLLERTDIIELIRDEFDDLPATTYTVTDPKALGEHLVRRIFEERKSD